jgi:hypothetical protein
MTDLNPLDPPQPTELELLKRRAEMLGVDFSNNIGLDTLKKRITDKLEGIDPEEAAPEAAPQEPAGSAEPQVNALTGQPVLDRPLTKKELRAQIIAENMRLIRIRITCMDPKKKDLPGEIFTIANEFLGTVRKYVPFGEATDDGYHVPFCIYQMLDEKRFLNVRTRKGKNGTPVVESNYLKEFSMEVLPALTQDELNRLATAQAAAGSLSDN